MGVTHHESLALSEYPVLGVEEGRLTCVKPTSSSGLEGVVLGSDSSPTPLSSSSWGVSRGSRLSAVSGWSPRMAGLGESSLPSSQGKFSLATLEDGLSIPLSLLGIFKALLGSPKDLSPAEAGLPWAPRWAPSPMGSA